MERAAQVPPTPTADLPTRAVPSTSPRVSVGHRQRAYRHDKENTDLASSIHKHRRQPPAAVTLQGISVANNSGVQASIMDPSNVYNSNTTSSDKLPLLARKPGVLIRAKVNYYVLIIFRYILAIRNKVSIM